MRVLFVTRGWPTETNPMSGNYEAVQAKALAKRGVEVTVLNMKSSSLLHIFDKFKVNSFDEDGVRIVQMMKGGYIIPGISLPFRWRAYLWEKSYRGVIETFSKENSFDVIHIHSSYVAYYAAFVKKYLCCPLVITEHWSALNVKHIRERDSVRAKMSYPYADVIICVSKSLSESVKNNFGRDNIVIHNMVSDSFFKKEVTNHDSQSIVFVGIGSLIPRKAFDVLIKGFSEMEDNSNCKLYILGEGSEYNQLQQLIEAVNLQNKVFLLGQKKPEDVARLINSSDCFVLTSRGETFGIVYIEAMAKGKPVIATRCGGPENFVDESNGLLIPVDNIDATSKALDYMRENARKYDSDSIRENCYKNFSEEVVTGKIVKVYRSLM